MGRPHRAAAPVGRRPMLLAAAGVAAGALIVGSVVIPALGGERAAGVAAPSAVVAAAPATTDPAAPSVAAVDGGQPGVDQPGVDQPGVDQPGVDQPGVDQPGVDETLDAAFRAAVVEQRREQKAQRSRHEQRTDSVLPAASAPSLAAGAPVWIVGDSIAAGLAQVWPGAQRVLAEPGARTPAVAAQVAALAAGAAPTLVVAAGTNDDPRDLPGFAANVRALLHATPGCVVWVTIHRPEQQWASLNAILQAEQANSGGRLQLADWDALARADPGLLQPDGIHPRTGSVYATIGGLARAALARCS